MSFDVCPQPAVYCIGDSSVCVPNYVPFTAPLFLKIRKWFDLEQYENILKFIQTTNLASLYFQVPDQKIKQSPPIYHNRAILYLTPLALSIFYGHERIANFLMKLKDENGERRINSNALCYVTNVSRIKGKYNDITTTYPFCLAICRELWEVIPELVFGGWNPHKEFKIVNRTAYTCKVTRYTDFLDYALDQLRYKAGLSIHLLIYKLFFVEHPSVKTKIFVPTPKDAHPLNLCSMARRLLRFSKYIDVNLRNFSQILNAIRVLGNLRFFICPAHSIFGINIFDRLKILKSGSITTHDQIIFDNDASIALFLGQIQKCIEKSSNNLKQKSILVLIRILFLTHWIYHFFIYEGPVLLYYFQHFEDVTCDLSVFQTIRNSIILYTKIDYADSKELLLAFSADNVRELVHTMEERSANLYAREEQYLVGTLEETTLISHAQTLTEKMFQDVSDSKLYRSRKSRKSETANDVKIDIEKTQDTTSDDVIESIISDDKSDTPDAETSPNKERSESQREDGIIVEEQITKEDNKEEEANVQEDAKETETEGNSTLPDDDSNSESESDSDEEKPADALDAPPQPSSTIPSSNPGDSSSSSEGPNDDGGRAMSTSSTKLANSKKKPGFFGKLFRKFGCVK